MAKKLAMIYSVDNDKIESVYLEKHLKSQQ